MNRADFGDGFTWGVASAAFQVEGAWNADGKRPSVWDEAGRRSRVRGGRVGDVAIDAFNRVDDDLDLIQSLGVRANRFSVSWPRVMGDGRGPWNARGAAYYNRLIDGMLERGLEPWLTVHHWDMPVALQQEGGWARRGIVDDFASLAEKVAEAFGDRVRHWMILNEPASILGHIVTGVHRRWGLHLREGLASIHHMNLACAEAGRRMRSVLGDGHQIGSANVFTVTEPYVTDDERLARAKAAYEALVVGVFVDPPAGLGYPFDATRLLSPLKRWIRDGDMESVEFDYDFQGVQYYGPLPLRRTPVPGMGGLPVPWPSASEARVRSAVGIPVDAEGLLAVLRQYRHHPGCRRFVLTENGFGGNDLRAADGRVHDDLRIWYMRTHLDAASRAIAEGIPLTGYFYWSYADNIEWVLGRGPRFGLVYVDYDDDCRRIVKDSGTWYRQFLAGDDV